MDVSTGDHDATYRIFGTVAETMEYNNEQIILAIEDDRNFMDLDVLNYQSILRAAEKGYQNWMPKEYCVNDWLSDICHMLEHGNKPFVPPEPDQKLVDEIDRIIELSYNPANKEQKYQARHIYKAIFKHFENKSKS